MEHFLGFLRYGDDFRLARRFISQYFNSREHVYLYPLLAEQVKILLKNLLNDPDKFESHIDRWAIVDHCMFLYSRYKQGKLWYYCEVNLWS